MNFQRGNDPKESMGVGIPKIKVQRVLQWQVRTGSSDSGFYILGPDKTRKALESLTKRSCPNWVEYIIDIFGDKLPDGNTGECLVKDLLGYGLKYEGKIYYIPEEYELCTKFIF